MSHEEGLVIVAAVADNPRCSAQEIKVNFGLKASKSTVKRRLYQAALKSRTAEQKVLLQTINKDKRLQFSQRHAGWIKQEWKKVIFTDESTFTTCWDQKTRIRRPDCNIFLYYKLFHSYLSVSMQPADKFQSTGTAGFAAIRSAAATVADDKRAPPTALTSPARN
ncbi:hypothetical protein HPB50_008120 [Hyalomma asiaticum]|uniref:Uncharacterized protein n=1 Tax=Hyalomma asiaticum TaxID=266040 RepID=A0ACB7S8G0_HYAAI|nr:hypothetical protein HPB50_008120 [Hyalomma asiaticum]